MRAYRRQTVAVAALVAGLLAVTPAAWSYFTTVGTGSGAGSVGTLGTPAGVSASASGTSVTLTWSGPAAPGGGTVDGYYVQRSPGSASGTCASSPSSLLAASASSCNDTGLTTGAYTYTVVAVYRSWTSSAASNVVNVSAAVVDHFDLTAPGTATAGTAFAVTVTAKDASGATVPGYAGSKALSWSGGTAAPNGSTPTYPPDVAFSDGVGTASIKLVKAETVMLTTTEGTVTGTSATIAVTAGTATQFVLAAGTPQMAGTAFSVGITAQDPYRNTATGYTGAKSLVWTGPGAAPSGTTPTYPATASFTAGVTTVPVTLVKAEPTALTVASGTVTGTSGAVTVVPAAASRLAWSGAAVSQGTLSSPCLFSCTGTAVGNFGTFTARVAVTDGFGNTVTNLGAGHTVTVSTPTTPATGSGGAFTAPTTGTSVTLTIASTGAAESTSTFTFKAQNGSWTSNTFSAAKATGSAYTGATGAVTKQ